MSRPSTFRFRAGTRCVKLMTSDNMGDYGMALQSHLAELERRHEALEKEIEQELVHPGADDLKLASLKRKKLQLKDQIERIRQSASKPTLH